MSLSEHAYQLIATLIKTQDYQSHEAMQEKHTHLHTDLAICSHYIIIQ